MGVITASLALALGLSGAGASTLNVPFLPQTPALCGGAAVAMVFRYWGDRHADMQQFAPLVDKRAGGIADDVLIAAVRQRGWQAVQLAGSVDLLRARVMAGQPLIILLEDRPGFYHYVVVVGIDAGHVIVHDPTWGPARPLAVERLTRLWQPSKFWTLAIAPGEKTALPLHERVAQPTASPFRSECDRRLDAALDEIERQGPGAAEDILSGVMHACPAAAAPIGELAGVRFAEKRWHEAEQLAERAVARDPAYAYGWELLAAARFVQDDATGALRAWNRIDKPLLDSVAIGGLSRTRYALVAGTLGLVPNTVLTERGFRLAERRLQQLPSGWTSRVTLRPADDGYATLDIGIAEREPLAHGWPSAASLALTSAVTRSVDVELPGWTGQGEMWTASWRWWSGRPRTALRFSAPALIGFRGVGNVTASWEAQTYADGNGTSAREERRRGSFELTDWATPDLWYAFDAALDSWMLRDVDEERRRTISFGATIEGRVLADRLALAASARHYLPISRGVAFRQAALQARFRSSRDVQRWMHHINAGVEAATDAAPMALWPGAGEGLARPALLRAHPLLNDGIVAGPVFGRRVVHVTAETERHLYRLPLMDLGVAVFVDGAAADRGRTGRTPLYIDVGVGIRVHVPGQEVFRVDVARGARDGRTAITAGIVTRPF